MDGTLNKHFQNICLVSLVLKDFSIFLVILGFFADDTALKGNDLSSDLHNLLYSESTTDTC